MLVNNRYEIDRTLGAGGSGVVFLARDIAIDRYVVLKEIDTDQSNVTGARIEREAKMYGRARHPSIASIYDVFVNQGKYFLVLEYVEGQTLKKLIEKGRISLKNSVQFAIGILQGLESIHLQKIIHRDIKPSNILISDETNQPVIIDLGIGKFTDDSDVDSLTQRNTFPGTPAYMSIESTRNSESLTPVSDVYSVGVVLYEMITSQLPYIADTAIELFTKAQSDPIPSAIELRPATPSALDEILEHMLAKSPDERATVSEAIGSLQELLGLDWDSIEADDNRHTQQFDSQTDRIPDGIAQTLVSDDKSVIATGFFSSEMSRYKEFKNSVSFYRSHLDNEYKTLIHQANISFWLWLTCSVAIFLIIASGIVLLFMGNVVPGSVTLASQVLVILMQRVFKNREDHYRRQAASKNEHLRLGNLWNLALQSLDGLGESQLRQQKLSEIVDALTSRIKQSA